MTYDDYNDDDDSPPPRAEPSEADEELLTEIRDRYRYALDYWHEVRRERNIDMKFICGDPWAPEDRDARKGRPVINHDELNQYINQSLNNIRQSKRGIKVEPAGEGSDDKSAEYRQNRIRAIEYKCHAQSAYETGFQQMLEGSYGFWRIGRRYVSTEEDNWDQEITISAIPNPDAVLYDPGCKQPDWSDAEFAFVLEPMSRDAFKRHWPNAQRTDFTRDDMRVADQWISEKTILVAEYWKVEVDSRKQTRRRPSNGKREARTVECRHVMQYITNGVEILERNEQPGSEIPIPAAIGLERYVDDGNGSKRKIFSLVRLARDPQLSLAYLNSQQMEEAGLSPKTPYVGYVGQFESQREEWITATKVPHPFLEIDPIPDSSNGQILPLPRREPFTPNFQSYEIAKDSARRAIQAAMGISPLPTAAMRANEKSGIAIQRIQQEQALGSYHFVDNFERAIERTGRIIESWLPVVDGGEREVAICQPDETRRIVRINTPEPVLNPATGQAEQYSVEEGQHDVTISVGPSNQSQREAADDFLNVLIGNLQALPVSPPQAAQLLAKLIQMKQLGPLGDQMAEIISPTGQGPPMPPQAQQAMQQAGIQLQQLQAYAQQLQQQLQQLQQERQAKVLDNQARIETERIKAETQLAVAEINTKAQVLNQRAQFVEDLWRLFHEQGHEHGLVAQKHAHERRMADDERQAELLQQAIAAQNQQQQQSATQPPQSPNGLGDLSEE